MKTQWVQEETGEVEVGHQSSVSVQKVNMIKTFAKHQRVSIVIGSMLAH